jgi:hypothetical protein
MRGCGGAPRHATPHHGARSEHVLRFPLTTHTAVALRGGRGFVLAVLRARRHDAV